MHQLMLLPIELQAPCIFSIYFNLNNNLEHFHIIAMLAFVKFAFFGGLELGEILVGSAISGQSHYATRDNFSTLQSIIGLEQQNSAIPISNKFLYKIRCTSSKKRNTIQKQYKVNMKDHNENGMNKQKAQYPQPFELKFQLNCRCPTNTVIRSFVSTKQS